MPIGNLVAVIINPVLRKTWGRKPSLHLDALLFIMMDGIKLIELPEEKAIQTFVNEIPNLAFNIDREFRLA